MRYTFRMKTLPLSLTLLAFATIFTPASAAPKAHAPAIVRTVSVGGDGGWDYLTADGISRRLYIARGSHVQVLDTRSGTLIKDITGLDGVHGVALAPEYGRGFITCGRSNSVAVFDTKTLKTLAPVPVGQKPDAIIYDPATHRIFTFNGGTNDSTVIDATTQKVVGTITLGGRPEFAVADGRGHVYVNLEDKSQIVDVDSKALRVLHAWPLAPGTAPTGLAMDTKHRRLFSACDNNHVVVMDADTGKVIASPGVGNGPDACAFDAKNGLVYVPNGEDGTLTVLHEDTPNAYSLVATVATQAGARTMALDTQTHHVFVVAAKTIAPAPGGGSGPRRRAYAPGTFVLIELAP